VERYACPGTTSRNRVTLRPTMVGLRVKKGISQQGWCGAPARFPETEFRTQFSEWRTTHPQRALRHKSLVPPCFVNQLLDRFAWSVNDRSRSNVSSFDGRHAQEKGRRPSRQGSARPGQSLSPHCRSQSPRSAERKSVIHVSGRFCWVKVNGQWLYKTRQIVTGRNKHPARWMLWCPNRRARIPSALCSAKPIRWRIR